LVEPVERRGSGDAVHAELRVDRVGVVHILLEVLDGLLRRRVVLPAGLRASEPAELHQLPLEVRDLRGGRACVDDLARRARRRGGRPGRAGLALELAVLVVDVAAVGVVLPRELRVLDRRVGARGVRRRRRRRVRNPQRVRGERRVRRDRLPVERVRQEPYQQKRDREHDDRGNADDHRPLLRGPLGLLVLDGRGCGGGGPSLRDVSRPVLLEEEVALLRVLDGLDARLQPLEALRKRVLLSGGGDDRAVV